MMVRCLAVLLLLFFALPSASIPPPLNVQSDVQYTANAETKVPVQLGVMSRCPDALLCENLFTNVLQKVSDKADLSLRYIAKLDPSEPVFGVKCMHGPEECAGNVQQLCAAKYLSSNWWEFIHCQNFEGKDIVGRPALAMKCAAALDIDWNNSEVGRCAGRDGSGKGEEGIKLLQESVKLSAESNLTKSCTVVINNEKVCIHDGIWKECENGHSVGDFVHQIKDAYKLLNDN